MNNFTLEELKDLECWLRITNKQDITLPSGKNKKYIENKIQKMINNYDNKIDKFIFTKFKEIAYLLPVLVNENPASFACGLKTGYKQCLLDLESIIKDKE